MAEASRPLSARVVTFTVARSPVTSTLLTVTFTLGLTGAFLPSASPGNLLKNLLSASHRWSFSAVGSLIRLRIWSSSELPPSALSPPPEPEVHTTTPITMPMTASRASPPISSFLLLFGVGAPG